MSDYSLDVSTGLFDQELSSLRDLKIRINTIRCKINMINTVGIKNEEIHKMIDFCQLVVDSTFDCVQQACLYDLYDSNNKDMLNVSECIDRWQGYIDSLEKSVDTFLVDIADHINKSTRELKSKGDDKQD